MKNKKIKPIFIFSLPRSGSTLLQRILATSEKITTVSEPWILLPLLHTVKAEGTISQYGHNLTTKAIRDFYTGFPNGKADYIGEIRNFTLNLYKKSAKPQSIYFLDKTPRYHLICKEIMDTFPDGRFIFLWRNPLAIVSSIINTWGNGNWKILYHYVDIYKGLLNIADNFENCTKDAISVRYESLLRSPLSEVKKICDYLDINYNAEMISNFKSVQFNGRYGDKSGLSQFTGIQKSRINAWTKTYNNVYRRYWARQYLDKIGSHRLSIMGYRTDKIKNQLLSNNENTNIFSDISRSIFYFLKSHFHHFRRQYRDSNTIYS